MSSVQKRIIVSFIIFAGLLVYTRFAHALTVDQNGNVVVERLYGPASTAVRQGGQVLSERTERAETTATGEAAAKIEQRKDETEVEVERTRTDVFEGGAKLRLERKDGRTVVKLEDEKGEETELPEGTENEIFKIQERADKGQIRVDTLKDKFVFSRENIGAATNFPLSVDLQTNQLTVKTPSGEKVVTVLPDQAVKNMLAANVIDQVKGLPFTQDVGKVATQAGTALEEVVKLTATKEDVLAYEIPGIKRAKFLGFISVEIPKTAVVSAETGELLETRQSFVSQALNLLSF